jgi:hypothetical protein
MLGKIYNKKINYGLKVASEKKGTKLLNLGGRGGTQC